jgi:hypothetical protein
MLPENTDTKQHDSSASEIKKIPLRLLVDNPFRKKNRITKLHNIL